MIVIIIVIVCCVCGKCKREQGDISDRDTSRVDSDFSDGHVHVHRHEEVDEWGDVHVRETVNV